MIRGVRGATTVNENNSADILAATEQLVKKMIIANEIKADDVAQTLISVTDDLNAAFPAKALREIEGWSYVPVMCTQEIPVPGGLAKCIRIMMTIETTKSQTEIEHIYLGNAVTLRPDLSLTEKEKM